MPELRKDPVVGRWVIIASERARRPGNFVDTSDNDEEDQGSDCAFCDNNRPTIAEDQANGINVVYSDGSVTDAKAKFTKTKKGLYDVIEGFGAHEIIIETPEHVANIADLDIAQIAAVFKMFASRIEALEQDDRFQFALAYKNYGPTAGSGEIAHTRSHITATPIWPLRVKEKLIGARNYYEQSGSCIYCDLIGQEQKFKQRIVCETEHFIAFIPFAARFLFETLILPKDHHCDFPAGVKGKEEDLAGIMKTLLGKLQNQVDDPAYNFCLQTAPFRRTQADREKWKTIEDEYHWHIELMPRLTRVAGFEKGTGFYICPVPPEHMAAFLRGE